MTGVSSPALVVGVLEASAEPAVLERTLPSDKQFHPSLRKLEGKLWTNQIIFLKLSVAANCDNSLSAASQLPLIRSWLSQPVGVQGRRRRGVSQFW